MKGSIVCFDAYGHWGGGQRILMRDASVLASLGYDLRIICPRGNGEVLKQHIPMADIGEIDISEELSDFSPSPSLASRALWYPRLTRKLVREMLHIRPQYVYALGSRSAKLALGACAITGTPLAWSAHNLYEAGFLDRLLAKRAIGAYCVSTAVRDQYLRAGISERVLDQVPNSISCGQYEQAPSALRHELSLSPADVLVGVVGRIGAAKGQLDFLRAMAPLMEAYGNVHAVIVGSPAPRDQSYLETLETIARQSGVAARFHFTGWRSDIPSIMQSLDIFVLTSEAEPFGVVLIEAMACSKPVVAYRAGAVPEITIDGQTALQVPTGRVDQLQSAIRTLVLDPDLRRRLGLAGYDRVRSHYDDEVVMPQVTAFFEKMALRSHARGTDGREDPRV